MSVLPSRTSRAVDRSAERVGSLYGSVAAAMRGVWRPRSSRTVRLAGPDGSSAVLTLHDSRLTGLDTIGAQVLAGRYEPATADLLRRLIRPGDTVVDVGANIGYFTLISALATGPSGRVVAFEPEPRNHAVLARNVATNGLDWVRTHQVACAADAGTGFLSVNGSESGWHRLVPGHQAGSKDLSIRLTTLDHALAGERVELVKIDVEGHEGTVVDGMSETLAHNPGLTVILEYSPSQARLAGLDPEAPARALHDAGLERLWVVRESRGRLEPLRASELGRRDVLAGDRSVNLVMRAGDLPETVQVTRR